MDVNDGDSYTAAEQSILMPPMTHIYLLLDTSDGRLHL